MAEFKIPKPEIARNKTIRFPEKLIEQVEKAISGTDCTFSAFVVEATRVALANLAERCNNEIPNAKDSPNNK